MKKKRNLSLGGFVDWINGLPVIFKYLVSLIVIADFWMVPKAFRDMFFSRYLYIVSQHIP